MAADALKCGPRGPARSPATRSRITRGSERYATASGPRELAARSPRAVFPAGILLIGLSLLCVRDVSASVSGKQQRDGTYRRLKPGFSIVELICAKSRICKSQLYLESEI